MPAIPPQHPSKKICSAKRPTRVATSLQDVFYAMVMSKQFVCTSMLPLGHPVPPSLMFHLLKSSWMSLLLETTFFSLKFTKYRLATGLRPDPLGELKRSPDPLYL